MTLLSLSRSGRVTKNDFPQAPICVIAHNLFQNLGSKDVNGGAVNLDSLASLISGCYFTKCSANIGGAIYTISSNINLSFCCFERTNCFLASLDNFGGNSLAFNRSVIDILTCTMDKCAENNDPAASGESLISSIKSTTFVSIVNTTNCFGRRGACFISLRSPLSTKCSYSNVINCHDTVLLELYPSNKSMNTFENTNFINCTLEENIILGSCICKKCSFFDNTELNDSGDIEYSDCCGQRPIGNIINKVTWQFIIKYNTFGKQTRLYRKIKLHAVLAQLPLSIICSVT